MSNKGQSSHHSRPNKIKDASLLIVGDDRFTLTLKERLNNLITVTATTTSQASEIISLIQSQQPDILILHSNSNNLELCSQIKQHSELAWIYCIVIEETSNYRNEGIRQYQNQLLINMAQSLESGADAYLQLRYFKKWSAELSPQELILQDQVLKAQIQVGLRHAKSCRNLLQANDFLSSIALADPLTEVNNRRALEWELPRQVQKAHTFSTALSLIILDVDHFKSINDNYGHQVGDRVLKLVANRLKNNLRVQDTLFRYGGEEFVVILSNTSAYEADMVAQRLCRLIGEQPFRVDEALAIRVTVSIGTSCLNSTDDSQGTTLLRRADHNLLKAKSTGRNQVVSEEGDAGTWGVERDTETRGRGDAES